MASMHFRICFFLVLNLHGILSYAQDQSITMYFAFNESELSVDERMRLLYFLSDSLDNERIYSIQIKGYCDFIDDDSYNNTLSQQRADFVQEILLSNGIKEDEITLCKGYGEKTADTKKDSEEERKFQRRVEVTFICACQNQNEETVTEETVFEELENEEENADEYFIVGDIEIEKYTAGDKFAIGRLNFIGGRHKLLPESIPALKNLLQVMEENPDLKIMIIGHICCELGSIDGYDYDTHTYNLSINRAKEIYEYLKHNGIDASRMQYKGMGPTQKIYPYETTEMQRTANRRVEIKILEM